ncbi:hypothetical protein GIB67_035884 [Kingdonia uniflora]|uniref:Uncharacterized protein n=1 Tax=Kingdonia uniflora TaxID=39325 RepID=A0A7J7P8K6_9MAGN|nr:hypothetical protein GIB67_035884 [Kingdonia uniflora]
MSTLVQLRKSPMRRDSPERKRGGGGPPCPSRRERCPPHPPPSSRHRSPPRTKSPIRISSSHRAPRSPTREKEKPKRERSSLSVSRSPSPRTMRIRRAQAERETDKWSEREQHKRARSVSHSPPRTVRVRQAKLERESDKVSERDRGRNNGAEGDRERHRENRVDKEAINDKRKRRSGRERGTDIEVSNDRVERRSARERGVDRDASNDRGEKRPGRERGVDKEAVSDRGDRRSARERGVDVEASNGRSERCLARERGDGREGSSDRGERKSSRDKKDVGFSRSKHDRSMSPHLDCGRSYKHTSRSPSRASRTGGAHDEAEATTFEGYFILDSSEYDICWCIDILKMPCIPFCPYLTINIRDVDSDAVAIMKAAEEALKAKEKEKPSFELSGKLAEETNRVKGVTLLFTEPSDARKPTTRWRLYVFKGGDALNGNMLDEINFYFHFVS